MQAVLVQYAIKITVPVLATGLTIMGTSIVWQLVHAKKMKRIRDNPSLVKISKGRDIGITHILASLPLVVKYLVARFMFFPTLGANLIIDRLVSATCWWDRIDENIILGALPFYTSVDKLYKEGVRSVINTCEEYKGPLKTYEKYGITQLWKPCVDFTEPRHLFILLSF